MKSVDLSLLTLSVLKCYRRETYFQWYPYQSDQLSRAWNMHKNVRKFDQTTRSKITCNLHGKICPAQWRFFWIFVTGSTPSRRTAAKRWEKKKKERHKKKIKWKAWRCRSLSHPKTWNFDFCACPSKNDIPVKHDLLVERKVHCHAANAFASRLELI